MSWHELKLEAAKALGVPVEEIEEPERAEQGDLAWPAFSKAKELSLISLMSEGGVSSRT